MNYNDRVLERYSVPDGTCRAHNPDPIFTSIKVREFFRICYECGTVLQRFSENIHFNDTNWYCSTCKAGSL